MNSKQDIIRYAVVGLKHGMQHVEVVLDNKRADIVALCDVNKDNLDIAVEKIENFPGQDISKLKIFKDYNEFLGWGEFDAIVIAVPPALHKEFAVKAITAKKHVLLEKPLTNTLSEAKELITAYKGAKTIFQVGYCVRSSQLIKKVMEIIKSGKIGSVVFVWWHMFLETKMEGTWKKDRRLGGGKLIDCGCHYMDIMQLFAGAPFYRVTAYGTEKGKTGNNQDKIPEVATVIFEYKNGAKGNFSISEVSPTTEASQFGIVGTNGIIYGNPWSPEGAGSLDCYTEGCQYREQITVNGSMASRGHLGFAEQHDAFIDAILEGKENPCSIYDGQETVLITTAVDRSISTGETIYREMLK